MEFVIEIIDKYVMIMLKSKTIIIIIKVFQLPFAFIADTIHLIIFITHFILIFLIIITHPLLK